MRPIGELHQRKQLAHAGAGIATKAGKHLQIRLPTQAGIESRRLDERPNTWKVTLWMGQRLTQNLGSASAWSHQPQQQANGGRLAGPIGANKASEGPGRNADREVINGFALPEMLTQTMGFDR